ncbi:hypothetical protein [Saccharopolyspora sp. NPDC002578]
MTKRRVVAILWIILTLVGLGWLLAGNLKTEFGPLVAFFVAASVGYGPARLIAMRRLARETPPIEPRLMPLRISMAVLGLITFGPLVAAAAGWIDIIPAAGGFLVGMLLLPSAAALFSDGYQGLWLDSLVFRGLKPPEDEWLMQRDINRQNAQRRDNQ